MKQIVVQALAFSGLTILLIETAKALPRLPASRSQVQDAMAFLHQMPPDTIMQETKLAKGLYRYAFLETSPDEPDALHLASQSQIFYRMMIDRYIKHFVFPIRERLGRGPSVDVAYAFIPGHLLGFSPQIAYDTYDDLVENFWRNYAETYVHTTVRQLQAENKPLWNGFNSLGSDFVDLPHDKKSVFSYLSQRDANKRFAIHRDHLVERVLKHDLDAEVGKAIDGDPMVLRRVSSFGASTSSRPALE